jgi:uncharacterized protein (TIGR04255 family)
MTIYFAPVNNTHAIEQVIFAVRVQEPFGEKRLVAIREDEFFQKRYPFRFDHLGVMTGIGSAPQGYVPLALAPVPHIVGLQFCDQFPDTKANRILFLQDGQISGISKHYDRWTTTAPDICNELCKILEISELNAETISLAYYDKFVSRPQSNEETPVKNSWEQKEIFNDACAYLPTNIFRQNEPWHSNHGYFEQSKNGNMLVNINIQKQKKLGGGEEISLVTHFEMPCPRLEHKNLKGQFDILHEYLKDAARSALSKKVGLAVGLYDAEDTKC